MLGPVDPVADLAGSVELGAGWVYWGEDQEAVVGTTVQCTCIAVKYSGVRMPGSSAAAIDGLGRGCPNFEAGECLKRRLVGMVYILWAAAAIVVSPGAVVVADAGSSAVLVAATEVATALVVAIEIELGFVAAAEPVVVIAASEAAVEKVVVVAAPAPAPAAIVVELAVVAAGVAEVVMTVVAATEAAAAAAAVVVVVAVGQPQVAETGYPD